MTDYAETEHVPTDDEFESPAEYDAHFDHPDDDEYKVVGFEDEYEPALTRYEIVCGEHAALQMRTCFSCLLLLAIEKGHWY